MIADGLHPKLARAAYESIDAANYSVLKKFEQSPAHVRQILTVPQEPTPALELGQAIHACVLEPERFETAFALAPKVDRRTKEGKAEWAAFAAENEGREILRAEDHAIVASIRDSVWAHPTASAMLKGGLHREVGAVWVDPDTEVRCKGMLDQLAAYDSWTWVIDLKTTMDASPRAFARDCAQRSYHAQAAFYLDGCNVLAPHARRFAWVACEKTPPFAIAVYEALPHTLEAGRTLYSSWLRQWKRCREEDRWPGYPEGVNDLLLPQWAFSREVIDVE